MRHRSANDIAAVRVGLYVLLCFLSFCNDRRPFLTIFLPHWGHSGSSGNAAAFSCTISSTNCLRTWANSASTASSISVSVALGFACRHWRILRVSSSGCCSSRVFCFSSMPLIFATCSFYTKFGRTLTKILFFLPPYTWPGAPILALIFH